MPYKRCLQTKSQKGHVHLLATRENVTLGARGNATVFIVTITDQLPFLPLTERPLFGTSTGSPLSVAPHVHT